MSTLTLRFSLFGRVFASSGLISFPSGVRTVTEIRFSGHASSQSMQPMSHLVGSTSISLMSSGKLSFSRTGTVCCSSTLTSMALKGQIGSHIPQ